MLKQFDIHASNELLKMPQIADGATLSISNINNTIIGERL